MYTTVTTKDIKLELVEAKRRTRDRRVEQQLSDEFMMTLLLIEQGTRDNIILSPPTL